jgi:holo-[acyl-carrier protein] synthase
MTAALGRLTRRCRFSRIKRLMDLDFNHLESGFGVGVDIENIGRFKKVAPETDSHFLNKIFTAAEIDYCFSCRTPAQHLAARFAGKEAVIKALAGFNRASLGYNDIEITNDKNGVPSAKIRKSGFNDLEIKLSLSHGRNEAIAFAVVAAPGKL